MLFGKPNYLKKCILDALKTSNVSHKRQDQEKLKLDWLSPNHCLIWRID